MNLWRYIETGNYPGRYYIIPVALETKFATVRYNLARVYFDAPRLIWRLDARSLRYIPNTNIIENSIEEPKWKD